MKGRCLWGGEKPTCQILFRLMLSDIRGEVVAHMDKYSQKLKLHLAGNGNGRPDV